MNDSPSFKDRPADLPSGALASKFAAACQQEPFPRIEEYLAQAPADERMSLLKELLVCELKTFKSRGERVQEDKYLARFPGDAEIVRAAFTEIVGLGEGLTETVSFSPAQSDTASSSLGHKAHQTNRRLGDYELIEEIGRGGMGVVYRARQLKADRIVALKVIRPEWLAGHSAEARRDVIERFRLESRTAARLEHAHIATVFDVGEIEGQHFYSMRYVAGPSLAELLESGALDARRAATYLRAVADALHEAHQHGILHRDLKPHNILLDQKTDRPLLTDFGLAKLFDSDQAVTVTGEVFGSPPYMSPEQARDTGSVTVATDVYALGATLYALICARPPFRGTSTAQTLYQVMNAEPVPPRRINASIGRDLETICLKCLEKEPSRRYATAAAVADDLNRYLEGEPIEARPVGRAERIWRQARRNPIVAGLSAVAMLLLLVVAVVSIASYWNTSRLLEGRSVALVNESDARAKLERQKAALVNAKTVAQAKQSEAEEARQRERAEFEQRRESLYFAQIGQAERALLEGDVLQVQAILNTWEPGSGETDFRGFEWYHLWRQAHNHGRIVAHDLEPVSAVAYSPDGTTVAATQGVRIGLWRTDSGEPVTWLKGHHVPVKSLKFSPDSRRLISGGGEPDQPGEVIVWDLASGTALTQIKEPDPVVSVAFCALEDAVLIGSATLQPSANTPGARFLSVRSDGGRVTLRSAASGQLLQTLSSDAPGGALSVACSVDGRLAAAGDSGGVVRVWDLKTSELKYQFTGQSGYVWDICFSPDGTNLACGSGLFADTGDVRVYDMSAGSTLQTLHQHQGAVFAIAYSPDGQFLATAGWDRIVRLWRAGAARDPRKGRYRATDLLATIYGHTNLIRSIAFSSDGDHLLTGTHKVRSPHADLLQIWPLEQHRDVYQIGIAHHLDSNRSEAEMIGASLLSHDSRWLAQISADHRSVDVQDLAGIDPLRRIELPFAARIGTFSADGRKLLLAGRDSPVAVWDIAQGRELYSLHIGRIQFALFAPDSPVLITCSYPADAPVIYYWHADSGQPLTKATGEAAHWEFTRPEYGSYAQASYRGFYPAPVSQLISYVPNQSLFSVRPSASGRIFSVTFGPMNTWAALLNGVSGDLFWFEHPAAMSVFCRIAPNGQLAVVSPYQQRPTKLWDLATHHTLTELDCYLTGGNFSSDSRMLLTAEGGNTARLWDASSGVELMKFEGHTDVVWDAAISPDGRRVATSSWDGTIKLWDPRDGRQIATYNTHLGEIWEVWFSSDGKRIVAGDDPDLIYVVRSAGHHDNLGSGSAEPKVTPGPAAEYVLPQQSLTDSQRESIEGLKQLATSSHSVIGTGMTLTGPGVTDNTVEQITHLNRAGLRALLGSDPASPVSEHPQHPERIDLHLNNTAITDHGLKLLLGWNRLVGLHVSGAPRVTAAGFSHLGEASRLLELTCSSLPPDALTMEVVQAIARIPSLRRISLRTEFDPTGMSTWSDLQMLESLGISIPSAHGAGLQHLPRLPRLMSVDVYGSVTDDDMQSLAACPSLESLYLSDLSGVTSTGIAALGSVQTLKKLYLDRTAPVADNGNPLDALGNLTSLRELSLSGDGVEAPLDFLSRMRSLERLYLQGDLLTTTDRYRQTVGSTLAGIEKLKHLQSIAINAAVNDEAVKVIAACTALDNLVLADCSRLSSTGFSALSQSPALKSLHCTWPPGVTVDRDSLAPLTKCEALRSLSLQGDLTPQALAALGDVLSLEILSLHVPLIDGAEMRRLSELPRLRQWTINSPLTDGALESLAPLKERTDLGSLSLYNTRISDQGLNELMEFQALQVLELGSPFLSAAAVERLSQALPRTRVIARTDSGWSLPTDRQCSAAAFARAAAVVWNNGGVEAAVARLAQQAEQCKTSLEMAPQDRALRRRLATLLLYRAVLLGEALGDRVQSETSLREALALFHEVPDDSAVLQDESVRDSLVENLHWCLDAQGKATDALALWQGEGQRICALINRPQYANDGSSRAILVAALERLRALRVNQRRTPRDSRRLIEFYRELAAWDTRAAEALATSGEARGRLASTLNSLAWLLVASEDSKLWAPEEALSLAQRVVEERPTDSAYHNTLGLAQYRAGHWKDAIASLQHSIQLSSGGSPYDWLILSMAHQQLGESEEARRWFERSISWIEEKSVVDAELSRFINEAKVALNRALPNTGKD